MSQYYQMVQPNLEPSSMVDQTHGKVTLHRQRRQSGEGGGRGCVGGNMSGCVGWGFQSIYVV